MTESEVIELGTIAAALGSLGRRPNQPEWFDADAVERYIDDNFDQLNDEDAVAEKMLPRFWELTRKLNDAATGTEESHEA